MRHHLLLPRGSLSRKPDGKQREREERERDTTMWNADIAKGDSTTVPSVQSINMHVLKTVQTCAMENLIRYRFYPCGGQGFEYL